MNVLGAERGLDALLDGLHADDRQHRHHLFLDDERVVGVGLGEEQRRVGGDVGARVAGEDGGVDADEAAVEHRVRAAAGAGLVGEGGGGELVELMAVELAGAGAGDGAAVSVDAAMTSMTSRVVVSTGCAAARKPANFGPRSTPSVIASLTRTACTRS